MSNSLAASATEQACRAGGEDDAHHGLEVPVDWGRAAALVARGGLRRVLVVGPPDAGKSSLCRVILAATAPCRTAALLDGDVGQKMVGPPACVTLGRSSPGERLALRTLAFVGTTDPVRGWRRVIDGVRRLAVAAEPEVMVVKTGGPLSGPGRSLKEAKIEALAPDLVLALGHHPAFDALTEAYPNLSWLRLAPSAQARRKAGVSAGGRGVKPSAAISPTQAPGRHHGPSCFRRSQPQQLLCFHPDCWSAFATGEDMRKDLASSWAAMPSEAG